jgi:hypothetical protein
VGLKTMLLADCRHVEDRVSTSRTRRCLVMTVVVQAERCCNQETTCSQPGEAGGPDYIPDPADAGCSALDRSRRCTRVLLYREVPTALVMGPIRFWLSSSRPVLVVGVPTRYSHHSWRLQRALFPTQRHSGFPVWGCRELNGTAFRFRSSPEPPTQEPETHGGGT